MPKISIIVPVYNSEEHLQHCVDSILAQTFKNFEILLIDDGSKDRSGPICDKYAENDERVRVFHKENGGVSSARNWGLDNARGEWIAFVDSDDYIAPDLCETLLGDIDEDFIVGSFAVLGNADDKHILKDQYFSEEQLTQAINEYLSNIHFTTVWGKLFKRSIIEQEKLRFHINIDSTEDTLFTYAYLLNVSSITMKSNIVYFYRHTDGGLSCKEISTEQTIETIKAIYCIITSLEKKYNVNLSGILYNLMNYIYLRSIRFVQNSSSNIRQRVNFFKRIHSYLPTVFFKEYSPALMGIRGKLFYFLARKEYYLLLSIYSYCLSI